MKKPPSVTHRHRLRLETSDAMDAVKGIAVDGMICFIEISRSTDAKEATNRVVLDSSEQKEMNKNWINWLSLHSNNMLLRLLCWITNFRFYLVLRLSGKKLFKSTKSSNSWCKVNEVKCLTRRWHRKRIPTNKALKHAVYNAGVPKSY